ncbi:response regulator [Halobacteriales archaeon QS_8_69_26]|nr:MAG: response regulator [Halobacteriales archaeon QS_8_69_26]
MTETVLVAEDDEAQRQLVRRAFRDGYRVETATDGRRTWEFLTQCEDLPDAVVLDVMMPEIDGFTLLERLRARSAFADLPVLVVSARSREEDVRRAIDAGATDYVTKPFDPDELRDRVDRAIESTPPPCA